MITSPTIVSRRHFLRMSAVGLATTVAAVGLAACGGTSASVATVATTPASTASKAVPVANAPSTAPASLAFVTWGDVKETNLREKQVAQFTKDHPSIKVMYTATPQNYWDVLQTRMAGGDAPDVYYLEPAHTLDLQCRGALLNLSPYVSRDHFDLSDFYPAGPLEYTVDGKLWALNRDFANQDIFYNVDMFQKAGVALPPKKFDAAGWTFDDFLTTCQKLTSGSGPTKAFGFAVPQGFRAYMAFIWSNGGDIVTDDAKKPAIDQPNAVEGLQFLEDLIGKYKVSPAPADLQSQNANDLFYTGRIGMIVSIPANIAQIRTGAKNFHWDVTPPPMGPHGTKRQVGGGGAGYGVYGKTKSPDAAWALMTYMTSADVQKQEVDAGTSMGSRFSVGDYFVQSNQGKDPSNVDMFVDASKKYLHTDPLASGWLQIQNILAKELAGIWDGGTPAKDVAASIARQMAPLLLERCGQ